MNEIIFKTAKIRGTRGAKGNLGSADAVPGDGIMLFDGDDIPEEYEEIEGFDPEGQIDSMNDALDDVSIPDGSLTSTGELTDIRKMVNNQIVFSGGAGAAVRQQINGMRNKAGSDNYLFSRPYDLMESLEETEETDGFILVGDTDAIKKITPEVAFGDGISNAVDEHNNDSLLSAGSTRQILGDGYHDTAPYLYRALPYPSTRALTKIVGASVGWNQFVPNTGSDLSVTVTSGHKYIMKKSGTLSIGASDGTAITGLDGGTDWITDLTILFGTAIADLAYSKEQSTAGSGISWLKSYGFFREPFYAYDPGSVQSVRVDRKEITGKNQLQVVGYSGLNYNPSAGAQSTPVPLSTNWEDNGDGTFSLTLGDWVQGSLVSEQLISGNSYTLKIKFVTQLRLSVYVTDESYTVMRTILNENPTPAGEVLTRTIALQGAESRIILYIGGRNEKATIATPQIEIGTTPTAYTPYKKTTITYDHSITLRGIPKLVNNSIQYDGDVYRSDGVDVVRFDEIDLGTKTFSLVNNTANRQAWATTISGIKKATATTDVINCVCLGFTPVSQATAWMPYMISMVAVNDERIVLCVESGKYANGSEMQAAMNGVKLVYELATPTTLSATPFTNPQETAVGGTEEFVDYLVEQGTRDVAVPVGHNTVYCEPSSQKMDSLPVIPKAPTTAGTYKLKARVTDTETTYYYEEV